MLCVGSPGTRICYRVGVVQAGVENVGEVGKSSVELFCAVVGNEKLRPGIFIDPLQSRNGGPGLSNEPNSRQKNGEETIRSNPFSD